MYYCTCKSLWIEKASAGKLGVAEEKMEILENSLVFTPIPNLNRYLRQSGKLVQYFQESWRLQNVLNKILKVLESKI